MYGVSKSVQKLIEHFQKLPGVGPKSAARLTYYLIRMPKEEVFAFADAIKDLKEKTKLCSICANISEEDPCHICSSGTRNKSIVCVVEEPLQVLALEKSGFKGVYHVLHGVISPLNNVGPEDLKIRELLNRLKKEKITEIVLATNPTMEGEATAMYLKKLIGPLTIRMTRIASGLPVGGDLEYADEVTLSRALEGRRDY
ncbi:recombination protein RecR [candidate division CPR3 bacterium GWF2_35_18]|uniref:Recombination protein RecR n=1 Tax=candidate division CPR3 bacterium GW2011_GWF2_35_18 TaxID=1618350 RepID=A0A0G0ER90_UNCC3|nr:MAG: Recombination protein RecR [candidate division CPR3 bacterium GW2011_GWF2_35_18]KKP85994.1 MAG: Recombination protein RecR [candidate division CPR3 bacterium GW2011_GWE2_35_7]OGB63720.1 MAG: recombination protein RecR [candidate division CPR3 bacterium GWF2_35_18]OGB64960.1 MAG: recombination protein RecR [candidate division CPR3 bacterium RIFOXYA2_FULL_35_13]OGB76562.1 MAG: recombination protein RecR [candidate division CPR3 bacterium RIFOXYC2_FULL_35_7]OGB78635.1 MAG: recombination p